MEKIPDRDRALLGYAHRDPFGNLPNSAAHRNSDADFHDVFGGPPRHSSFYESRRSRGDSLESPSSLRGRGSGEDGGRSRRPWSGGEEKPVFGEMSSPARRRYLGDDFFDDIFPGSESSGSTLRKHDRDSYPSSPGSRVLSRNRPVLASREPYVGSSSLPAQLSHSVKLAKVIDHPSLGSPTNGSLYKNEYEAPDVFSSPSSPNSSVSSFTTREIRAQIDARNDGHAFYRHSPLSRQFSYSANRSLKNTDSTWLSTESQYQKDSLSLESHISSSQFHFSICRWTGKGVKLVLPCNSEERNKKVSKARKLPEVVIHEVDLASDDDNISIVTGASESQSESHTSKLLDDFHMGRKFCAGSAIVDNHLPAKFELKNLHSDSIEESGTCKNINKEVPVTKLDTRKSGIRNLCQLFNDEFGKQGHEDVIIREGETRGLSRGQRNVNENVGFKERDGRENSVGYIEVTSTSIQDAPICVEDKMPGGRIKGKVKEFIKIFSHEGSPKRESTFKTQERRSKGKHGSKSIVEDQHSIPTAKADKKVKSSHENNGAFLATSVAINEILNGVEKLDSNMSSDIHMNNDLSSERINIPGPCSESTHKSTDASIFNVEDYHNEDIEECLVEELSQEQNDHLQSNLPQDQFKISDAQIWEWSKGKEGNIRSLLSTLQYVLWPECGWKPIPLVDIIEGTAVKRAYQKALLCLHPDKLQQRAVAIHQKYIAEKVFDILQEAWTQFSSVSGL
ncbi:J domain-containing protein required for chloroplast accumulation response 1 isoform X2 [Phoenix dactylifera]|uniref:J domain-containing protein required for chloroplast accumulation response 1 isoform X2 n=1 Tax=Phoenix dactylifera TaxID=42345 RepID=A0A8B8ZFD3_PHODC|nr:J domain-containing protein required for chloroplast accumulation response 1 isoform X2 [Phoenix dactylifera]